MDPTTVLVMSRAAERLLIVFFAGVSIWMGWKLFLKQGGQTDHQAELSYKDLLIRLRKVGPGIFFALFGVGVMIFSLMRPLQVREGDLVLRGQSTEGHSVGYSLKYLALAQRPELHRWIVALNTIIPIVDLPIDVPIPEPDRALLQEAGRVSEEIRNSFLGRYFTPKDRDIWLEWRSTLATNSSALPEEVKEVTERIDEFATTILLEETNGDQ